MFKFRFAAAVAASIALASISTGAWAQEVTLRYSNWLPPGFHLVDKLMKPWIAEVERVTEGRVKVEMTPKVVGTVAGQYDVLADGLADLSLWTPGYSPGRFPLAEGFELPFVGSDPVKLSVGIWNAYNKYLANTGTFSKIHVVSIFSSNSSHVMTTKDPLLTVESFSGKKLRTPSPVAIEVLNLLGAVSVPKPMGELYEMASSGVVDGAIMPIDPIRGFKLQDVLKNITRVEGGLNNTAMVIGINRARWQEISEKDREAITAISGEVLARKNGELLQQTMDDTIAEVTKVGMTVHDMSPEEIEKLKKTLQPIRDAWVAKAKQNGLENADELLRDLTGGGV
jgi:TRAP-type C4-dicarboxylate transport system substrate-binding protein